MTVIGSDSRQVTTAFTTFPFSTVTTVDAQFSFGNGIGTGILIGPNHVLTAGHNAYSKANNAVVNRLRTTISANEDALGSRVIGRSSDPGANVTNINFLANYDTTGAPADDIALFTTSDAPLAANETIGLIAFVDPESAKGLTIDTAGYPGDNVSGNIPGNTGARGRDLVRSPGTADTPGSIVFTNGRRFYYSTDVDTAGGQSGSGVWHTLEGDNAPRVLGIHAYGSSRNNSGTLITTELYEAIVAQMKADSGTANANDLPENAIIGTNPGFFSFLTGSGNDFIRGSYRRERILGQDGDDRLFGGGANDRLEGGDGVDQALFADEFRHYDFTIIDPSNPAFEFRHTRGTQADGTDTTKEIEFAVFEFVDADHDGNDDDGELFFVPLQVDPDDNTKLKDGPQITPETAILDGNDNRIGTLSVASPAWMFDGDVDYTLTIGSAQRTVFNFAYIIDVSGSVTGQPLQEAQNAYTTLTNALINRGIADNSLFTVIPFSSDATAVGPLTPTDAISTIQGLTAGGFTNFNAALTEATTFFGNLPSSGATNVAYFLSDGDPTVGGFDFTDNAATLQSVADVRAFGIGNVDINNLNIIDSNTAEFLADPSDLDEAFTSATISRDVIERVDVKLAGNVIQTIDPSQLVEDALGLQFKGTIDNLEVSRTAVNEVTFEVVFNDGTPTASLDYTITTGQEQVTSQTDDGTQVVVVFSVNQSDFVGTAENEQVVGNDLDNVIDGGAGDNTLLGNGGNDRFILSGGTNTVDGGDGIDTVVIASTQAEAGNITQTGNIINIGTDTTLLNVEFIEFTDVRLATDTLTVTPILSLSSTEVSITEGDAGNRFATFTVNLSSTTTEDVLIDFSTQSDEAIANVDFVEIADQLTITAGETSGEITIEILDDTEVEDDELILLNLTAVTGATFANGVLNATAGLKITDNESVITVPITADSLTVTEGDPNTGSTFTLLLERFGNLSDSDTIEVAIMAAGDNAAQANDLVNGFTTHQVTFAPGADTASLAIEITADEQIEGDETFGIQLTNIAGSAVVPSEPLIVTILDEDLSISSTSDQNNNNTLVLDSGEEFRFTVNTSGSEVGFSQQLVAIAIDSQDVLVSTLGNISGLPETFSTDNLFVGGTRLETGTFQFGLQAPDGEITTLELSDVTADGFNLSGNGVEIAVSVADGTEEIFVEGISVGNTQSLGIEIADGVNNLARAQVTINATLHREAAFNNTVGFYLIDAADNGVVIDPLTGQAATNSDSSNRLGHLQAALDHTLITASAPANNQTSAINETFNIANLDADTQLVLVPYLIANGNAGNLSAGYRNMYSSFIGTNADGTDHVRLLSNNAFGFEDLAGGGDNDFDDIIVQVSNVQVNGI